MTKVEKAKEIVDKIRMQFDELKVLLSAADKAEEPKPELRHELHNQNDELKLVLERKQTELDALMEHNTQMASEIAGLKVTVNALSKPAVVNK